MSSEPVETLYEFHLSGDGVSIKKSVSAEIARAIVNLVMAGATAQPAPQFVLRSGLGRAQSHEPNFQERRERLSLREYMDSCEASRNPDKIVAIGHYLIESEGAADFGRDEVKGRFRAAGEPVPANYSRDFAWAIKSGWIAEDTAASGRYYVTQKGRAAIAAKFSGEVKKSSPQRKGKRGRRKNDGEQGNSEDQ